jgi:hypothetical protein
MIEYLIRRVDGEWFNEDPSLYAQSLRPSSFGSEHIDGWGNWRIRCQGVEISFSFEDPGIQVSLEEGLPRAIADQIVHEICDNIERVTGQKGRVVAI